MTSVRRPSAVRKAGPYKVSSCSDGSLSVTPTWPDFPVWNADEGGGPGLFSRLHLAGELERWLNNGMEARA